MVAKIVLRKDKVEKYRAEFASAVSLLTLSHQIFISYIKLLLTCVLLITYIVFWLQAGLRCSPLTTEINLSCIFDLT
jgi:hypothetical protein